MRLNGSELMLRAAFLTYSSTLNTRDFDSDSCCTLALSSNSVLDPPTTGAVCGAVFSDKPAAPNLLAPYSFCKSNCDGFILSRGDKPGEWAAPIVQFILPSIIFSMSIPQRKGYLPRLELANPQSGRGRWFYPYLKTIIFVLLSVPRILMVFLETLLWVTTILVYAGPMMVSGLHEAVLDYKILRTVLKENFVIDVTTRLYLIVTVVSGNLIVRVGDPFQRIPRVLEGHRNKQGQLRGLMTAQNSFGATIAAPVVFYLGAFIYTILDLLNKSSDQDAAIALAFGVEWMIIVHVAIISGCLLASNNPSAVSVLVGDARPVLYENKPWWRKWAPEVYNTTFQPVTMWKRGKNKEQWLSSHLPSNDPNWPAIRKSIAIKSYEFAFFVLFFALVLIGLPPAAGAVVAWKTPPVGWSCRSISFVCYAACQVFVVAFWSVEERFPVEKFGSIWRRPIGTLMLLWQTVLNILKTVNWLLHRISIFLSLVTALGSTTMQIIGVYRNCFCYVTSDMWFNLDNAVVNVASDTAEQRLSSTNWIIMGGVATGFMAACCYIGWRYQKSIRDQYEEAIGLL